MKSTTFFLFLLITACISKQIKEKEIFTHYEVYGNGDPLLLINGGPGYSSEGFRSLAKQLADSLEKRVIIYDQRGTGQSRLDSLSTDNMSLELMLQDIEELRMHLDLKSWIVMGHSFGGMLGAFYTSKYPDRVESLILSSSGGMDMSTFNSSGLMEQLTQVQWDSMIYWTNRMREDDTSKLVLKKWAESLAPAYVYDDKYAPLIAERLTQGNREVSRLIIQDLQEMYFDIKEPLARFTNPVLIIQGKEDVIRVSTSEATHDIFPNSTLILLDSCGHYGWLESADRYFTAIEKFLNRRS